MGRTHLLAGAVVAFTACVFLGCAAKPKAAAPGHPATSSAAARARTAPTHGGKSSTHEVPPEDAPAASAVEVVPNSMAQHAKLYAQNLESLLAKRSGSPGAAAPKQPVTTQPAAPEQPDVGA